jgi:hypothetical protein
MNKYSKKEKENFNIDSNNSNDKLSYLQLLNIYNNNKFIIWHEWLNYYCTFPKPGKQGIVGLLKLKNQIGKNECNNGEYIFKISQYINYLAEHENLIMTSLNSLRSYCPHFCKSYGLISCEIDPNNRKSGNPFKIDCNHPIEKEVLLIEHIDNSKKFFNYIRSSKISDHIIYSTIKQVLFAISIAQQKQFTHYDLHSYNVLMKQCDSDLVHLYILNDNTQFSVPTFGHYPIIIDFGFSYIQDMQNKPMWPSLAFTDVGFNSTQYDSLSDPKLFLITVSQELINERKSKKSKKFRNIIKNIFSHLSVDWESGWDTLLENSASDYINHMLEDYKTESDLFNNYDHFCIDMIQSLIILPLQSYDYFEIHIPYLAFIKEFAKIENEIGNAFYNLYILKGIIDIARNLRSQYIQNDTRFKAISLFKSKILDHINLLVKFCRPKNINYELLLCSLYEFSRKMEGCLYDYMTILNDKKYSEVKKLPISSIEEIIGIIDTNIPSTYIYTTKSKILLLNSITKSSEIFTIPEKYLHEVNSMNTLAIGNYIYQLYLNSK